MAKNDMEVNYADNHHGWRDPFALCNSTRISGYSLKYVFLRYPGDIENLWCVYLITSYPWDTPYGRPMHNLFVFICTMCVWLDKKYIDIWASKLTRDRFISLRYMYIIKGSYGRYSLSLPANLSQSPNLEICVWSGTITPKCASKKPVKFQKDDIISTQYRGL